MFFFSNEFCRQIFFLIEQMDQKIVLVPKMTVQVLIYEWRKIVMADLFFRLGVRLWSGGGPQPALPRNRALRPQISIANHQA